MEIGVHKICHECKGIMVLDTVDQMDPCSELMWQCTWCGINETHTEFVDRLKNERSHY